MAVIFLMWSCLLTIFQAAASRHSGLQIAYTIWGNVPYKPSIMPYILHKPYIMPYVLHKPYIMPYVLHKPYIMPYVLHKPYIMPYVL